MMSEKEPSIMGWRKLLAGGVCASSLAVAGCLNGGDGAAEDVEVSTSHPAHPEAPAAPLDSVSDTLVVKEPVSPPAEDTSMEHHDMKSDHDEEKMEMRDHE